MKVDAGSRLARLLGVEERSGTFTLGTNSMHHQCVDLLGDGVRAVAWAADGTIEGIEVDGAPNVVGVQWHPETLRHLPAHLGLFRSI